MNTDNLISYHIFTFPFIWEHSGKKGKYKTFEEKTDIHKIRLPGYSMWENTYEPEDLRSKRELYNEENYFYRFVHPALYDRGGKDDLIRHYERKEVKHVPVTYCIKHKESDTLYQLPVRSITLNVYATGVGILSFYVINEAYKNRQDILNINQFGRRIFPPFLDAETGVEGTKSVELAEYISIEGLNGHPYSFTEDFTSYNDASHTWKPARFINSLLEDFTDYAGIDINPVVDDRMFVSCWWGDNSYAAQIKNDPKFYLKDDFWYKLIFVDAEYASCQNVTMRKDLLKEHTLPRWQKEGTLYGLSRYSMVSVMENSDFTKNVLLTHFRTIYHRIIELCIVQRASLLKYSNQVVKITELKITDPGRIADEIGRLYKQFIRFENQIYFNDITSQEQGIETYDKLQKIMRMKEKVNELDKQINELHGYVIVLENQERNRNLALLTIAATMFIIPSFIAGYFSMRGVPELDGSSLIRINVLLLIVIAFVYTGIKARKRIWIRYVVFGLIALIVLYIVFIISGIVTI